MVSQSLQTQIEQDPEAFLEDLRTRGDTLDTRELLRQLGGNEVTDEDLTNFFTGAFQIPEEARPFSQALSEALPLIVKPRTMEWALKYFGKNPDKLRRELVTAGRNEKTEALVKSLYPDITERGLKDYFTVGLPLKAEAEAKVLTIDDVRQLAYISPDGKAFNSQNQWVGTYNRATGQLNPAKSDEGWFKDNIIDPWNMASNQLGHNLEQFGSGVLANILFRDLTNVERAIYGDEWVDQVNAGNKELRDTFRLISAESQRDFDNWVIKHPELIPKPEYVEGLEKHPELLLNPGYFAYEFSSTAPLTVGIMAIMAGGIATGNIPLATLGGIALMTPAESADAYQGLLDAGAPETEAAQWSLFIGTAASLIEIFSDLLFLKFIAAPVANLFRKEAVKQMSKATVAHLVKKGVMTYTATTAMEIAEEELTLAINNAVTKVYDENKDLWEGMVETGLKTFAAVTPTALLTGGGTMLSHQQVNVVSAEVINGIVSRAKDAATEAKARPERGAIELPGKKPAEKVAPEVTISKEFQEKYWVKDLSNYKPLSSGHAAWGEGQAGFNITKEGKINLTDNRKVRDYETDKMEFPTHRELGAGFPGLYSFNEYEGEPTQLWLYP